MTKKHFEAIAYILQTHSFTLGDEELQHSNFRTTCRAFASFFAGENCRFDRTKFLAACGVEE